MQQADLIIANVEALRRSVQPELERLAFPDDGGQYDARASLMNTAHPEAQVRLSPERPVDADHRVSAQSHNLVELLSDGLRIRLALLDA